MKKAKISPVLLGAQFVHSPAFKIWQISCKLRKFTNNASYQKFFAKNKQYHYGSPGWIKKVIVPSKAFKRWIKYYTFTELIKGKLFALGKKYLPQKIKLILKRNMPSLFPSVTELVSEKILATWKKWTNIRTNKSFDIINFSVIAYNYRIQRPQHIARELAKLGHRVFYIENDFAFSPHISQPQIIAKQEEENLYTIKLSSSKNYFIYGDIPSEKDKKIIIASLKLLLYEARILNPIAKIDHPFWAAIASELGMPIMYDVMDLHSGFKETSAHNLQYEKDLLQQANIILASSDYLHHKFRAYDKHILPLKNAGEFTHFVQAAKPSKLPIPADMKMIHRPVIGYYGALADWLNTDLIEGLAKDFPQASIVLIGLVNNTKLERLSHKYRNIHLLGEKKYQELPAYLARFDVALIPFKLNKLIQATNPVKIYEYFAAGIPVVATSIPELMPYKKIMYLADNPQSFTRAVKKALTEKSLTLKKSRQQIAKLNTWQHRAATLEKRIFELYPKVSVIILTYNHKNLSKITIDTVLDRSKYPSYEVIVVDNQSDKETLKMLKEYLGKENIKVIFNEENYGFAKGNNVGMKAATGEYMILLNNDVRVTPGWIERLLYHAQGKEVGLVGPVTNSIGNESQISIAYDLDNQQELEEQAAQYTYSHWGQKLKLRSIAAFAWLHSRALYKLIGGFDEQFGKGLFEDDDYCMRVRKQGLQIICAEDAFVHHYGGASTSWGSKEYQKLFIENKAKFENKWAIKWIRHHHRKGL